MPTTARASRCGRSRAGFLLPCSAKLPRTTAKLPRTTANYLELLGTTWNYLELPKGITSLRQRVSRILAAEPDVGPLLYSSSETPKKAAMGARAGVSCSDGREKSFSRYSRIL
eukprot:scaffold301_cov243-Pinguiococcus_pyrenoidosus.AAC.56